MLRSRGTAKPGAGNAAIAQAFELLIPVMTSGWIDGLKMEDETGESLGGRARTEHFQQPPTS